MSAFKYRKYLASFIAVLLLALSGMASAAALGEPLAPQVIYDEGGITSIPSTPGAWDVNGTWTNKYKIWIHSGDVGGGGGISHLHDFSPRRLFVGVDGEHQLGVFR